MKFIVSFSSWYLIGWMGTKGNRFGWKRDAGLNCLPQKVWSIETIERCPHCRLLAYDHSNRRLDWNIARIRSWSKYFCIFVLFFFYRGLLFRGTLVWFFLNSRLSKKFAPKMNNNILRKKGGKREKCNFFFFWMQSTSKFWKSVLKHDWGNKHSFVLQIPIWIT